MSKVYVVTVVDTSPSEFFVRAETKAEAKRHVIDRRMIIRLATPEDMYEAGQAGLEIEVAGVAEAEPAPEPGEVQ